jgi:UDP-glucose 4-epimerase
MKYIITGGEGFIGSQIVKLVRGEEYDLKSGKDILDQEALLESLVDTEAVFHCAAKISVPESVEKPDFYYLNNVTGTKNVIEAAEKNGVKKIIFSSSAAVYGEQSIKVTEDLSLNPLSPYAQNKIDGEELLKNSQISSVALRYFNVYGPGQSDAYAGVITHFIKRALNNEDITIFGDGNQKRDFIFVTDIAAANKAALDVPDQGHDVFNIGNGKEISITDLAKLIIEVSGSTSKIVYADPRPGDIVYSCADISKAQNKLKWQPTVSLEEGLRRTIESYRYVS